MTKIFVEHIVLARDLDSLMEQPITVFLLEDSNNIESRSIRLAKKSNQNILMETGNTIDYEYYGLSGKKVEAVSNEGKWVINKEISPATVDINDLFTMD